MKGELNNDRCDINYMQIKCIYHPFVSVDKAMRFLLLLIMASSSHPKFLFI